MRSDRRAICGLDRKQRFTHTPNHPATVFLTCPVDLLTSQFALPWSTPNQPATALGNAENFDLFCFSRSIFIHNLHYYQAQLRPSNSPLDNQKRVEHNVNKTHFFNLKREWEFLLFNLGLQDETRISGTQSHASRRDWEKFPSISGNETRSRFIVFDQRHWDENDKTRRLLLELSWIWFVACNWTDIFQKKGLFIS